MIKLDGDGFDNETGETVLEALKKLRVVAFSKMTDGRFRVSERCENHYSAILTAEQVLLMANELRALVESSNNEARGGALAPSQRSEAKRS